jgi:NADH-quinone oxidoreductase subunit I
MEISMGAAPKHDQTPSTIPVAGARNVKKVSYEMTAQDRSYLVEAVRGLGVTTKHLVSNLGKLAAGRKIETVQYPEEKRPYPERFRAQHRLLKREDGSPRCVACFMCATACPADCIHIEAEERDGETDKRPKVFDLDHLRCVDCGLCVEACPCDAIRMDTGIHPPPALNREDSVLHLEDLLSYSGQDDGPLPKTARTMERGAATPSPSGKRNT